MKHLHTFESFLNEAKKKKTDYSSSKNIILVGLKTNLLKDMRDRYDHEEDGDNIHFFTNNGEHFGTLFDVGTRYQELRHNGKINDKGWLSENQEPGSAVSEKKQELGLYVTGSTSNDNTKIGKWLDKSIFHAEWNARDGYWLFPADDESEYDELEKELDKEFAKHGINARFEGIFESQVNEKMDVNDPILVAMRAAKEDRKKSAAAYAKTMKNRVYGKQREKLENDLSDITQDLKDLYSDKRSVLSDMDAEAGEKGNDWSDDDANRYGEELNKIDSKIEALLIKRQEIEIKLAY